MNNRAVNIIAVILLILLIIIHWFVGIPIWTYSILLVAFVGLKAYGSSALSAQFFTNVKFKGSSQSSSIALTFDDGPLPRKTERILDILNQHSVKAAFFCIGKRITESPALLKRIHEEGHVIGNHSFLHGKFFSLQSAAKMSEELKQTDEVIRNTIGVQPRFFRPPYGVTNPNLAKAIKNGNYETIGWSIRSMDTITKDEEKLFSLVTNNLKGGDVILFHDFSETTIAILPRLLEFIHKNGLKVARLDELLNEQPYV